jgi:hypothetical protein
MDGKSGYARVEGEARKLKANPRTKKKTWNEGRLVTFHSKNGSRTLDYAGRHVALGSSPWFTISHVA